MLISNNVLKITLQIYRTNLFSHQKQKDSNFGPHSSL